VKVATSLELVYERILLIISDFLVIRCENVDIRIYLLSSPLEYTLSFL